jgi:hypothetical protein
MACKISQTQDRLDQQLGQRRLVKAFQKQIQCPERHQNNRKTGCFLMASC